MSLPVVILPQAERDLADAKEWYEEKGLREEFRQSIENALDRISRAP